MDIFKEYWPFLIPLVIAELGLAAAALVHVCRHPHYRFGNKTMWILVVLIVQIAGPIVYFVFGRGDEQ